MASIILGVLCVICIVFAFCGVISYITPRQVIEESVEIFYKHNKEKKELMLRNKDNAGKMAIFFTALSILFYFGATE